MPEKDTVSYKFNSELNGASQHTWRAYSLKATITQIHIPRGMMGLGGVGFKYVGKLERTKGQVCVIQCLDVLKASK